MCRGDVSERAQQCTQPFDRATVIAHLPFDLEDAIYLEITDDESLFSASLDFLTKLVQVIKSLKCGKGGSKKGYGKGFDSDDEDFFKGKGKGKGKGTACNPSSDLEPSLGLGWHNFSLEQDDEMIEMWALYQRQTCYQSPRHSLVLFTKGPDSAPLVSFCKLAKAAATEPQENMVRMMRIDPNRGYWAGKNYYPRSLSSVVLDAKVKQALLEDVEWFVEKETRNFYYKHGIAYHRCYLLHGPPGAGKTSMISALAGHLRRNLCFLQMTGGMTDDTLSKAMSGLDKNSIVVLEDVDALFTNHRESTSMTCSLSFSGFINSLDGLGAPEDVIIFMTSNHPEKLDPAMLRPGRVDMQIEFKAPGKQAAAEYFKTFYPDSGEAADNFNEILAEDIASRRVSMAQLQHFFLKCHRLKLKAPQVADYAREHDFKISCASSKHYS